MINIILFVHILQQNYLAQVTSNIWGTKFKIVGLATFLPTNLGAGNHQQLSLLPLALDEYINGSFLPCFSFLSHLQDESPPSAAPTDDHLPARGAQDLHGLYQPACF